MSARALAVAAILIVAMWLAANEIARRGSEAPDLVSDTAAGQSEEDHDAPAIPSLNQKAVATPPRSYADGARKETRRTTIAPNPDTAKAIEQIRFWRQQAASGDPHAMCRFALASTGCAMRRSSYAPWARNQIPELRTEEGERVGEDCSGVAEADVEGRFEVLLDAAKRGHAPSALFFAMGGGMSSFIPAPDEIRAFRAHAPRLAWQAFAAGDSDAAVLLWRAYNRVRTDFVYLAAAIDPDPVKAHALDLLMGDLVPGFVVGTAAEAGLSKAQAALAEAMRAEWRATAFAHGRPPRYGMEIERLFDWDQRAVDLCAPDPR